MLSQGFNARLVTAGLMSGECDFCGNHSLECDCHINDRITEYKPEWGFHNLMVLAAFRYCMGRTSYIVGSCVDWLIAYWKEIDANTKKIILEETVESLNKGHAGDRCDVEQWKRLVDYGMDKYPRKTTPK